MSKTEKPSIRFHGFDDTWEQRKLCTASLKGFRITLDKRRSIAMAIEVHLFSR